MIGKKLKLKMNKYSNQYQLIINEEKMISLGVIKMENVPKLSKKNC